MVVTRIHNSKGYLMRTYFYFPFEFVILFSFFSNDVIFVQRDVYNKSKSLHICWSIIIYERSLFIEILYISTLRYNNTATKKKTKNKKNEPNKIRKKNQIFFSQPIKSNRRLYSCIASFFLSFFLFLYYFLYRMIVVKHMHRIIVVALVIAIDRSVANHYHHQ